MDTAHEDRYVVYLRHEAHLAGAPEAAEEALVTCDTYEEAHRIKHEWSHHGRVCVIRYVGPTGGGD